MHQKTALPGADTTISCHKHMITSVSEGTHSQYCVNHDIEWSASTGLFSCFPENGRAAHDQGCDQVARLLMGPKCGFLCSFKWRRGATAATTCTAAASRPCRHVGRPPLMLHQSRSGPPSPPVVTSSSAAMTQCHQLTPVSVPPPATKTHICGSAKRCVCACWRCLLSASPANAPCVNRVHPIATGPGRRGQGTHACMHALPWLVHVCAPSRSEERMLLAKLTRPWVTVMTLTYGW